ncbi:hypothetical protein IQ269_09555 [Tychonema sp. LEGE 07199]|uniref:hypothetical protein n=1 Tax=unclassified Tychonema TaxID=2642144 RepID=UPI00187E411D|nr:MULTISPECIES: hypothetical protein [unclassified Tychonema]MBE9121057.1 hypothetical protein [Tychonema sp. LEGE 07199]MBE9133480.1 hypothetical protein [Tychonema sp. LEGE 07196]
MSYGFLSIFILISFLILFLIGEGRRKKSEGRSPREEVRGKFGNEQCTGCSGCNGCNGCKSVGRGKREEGRGPREEGIKRCEGQ